MAIFACATWRPIGVNQGGAIGDPSRGLLLHHQAGNGSLFNWFSNPAAGVSAHFWVSKTGLIEQYVDTSRTAWHAISGNVTHGVETEGCPTPPHAEPMTEPQLDAMGRLYAEGMRVHGWPNQLADAAGARGLGYHRLYVNTACPCQVRVDARADILRRAGGAQPPRPEPFEEDPLVIFRISGGTYVSNNINYRWVVDQWDLNALRLSNPNIIDLGTVNGLNGFGVPADPTTAKLSNQPWPAEGPAKT